MRIPAIYRPQGLDGPEHLVWIVTFMTAPQPVAITIDGQGTLWATDLFHLEVVGWPDDDDALKLHRPPTYGVGDAKIRSISDRPART
jgi:hypothetical protein